jgi:hypothetical protein
MTASIPLISLREQEHIPGLDRAEFLQCSTWSWEAAVLVEHLYR